jgi:hypothetical protein
VKEAGRILLQKIDRCLLEDPKETNEGLGRLVTATTISLTELVSLLIVDAERSDSNNESPKIPFLR